MATALATEEKIFSDYLTLCHGNVSKVAEILGVKRVIINTKVEKLGLAPFAADLRAQAKVPGPRGPRQKNTCERVHDAPKALRDLPDAPKGALRHKCAACAFALGLEMGLSSAQRDEVRMMKLLKEMQHTVDHMSVGT